MVGGVLQLFPQFDKEEAYEHCATTEAESVSEPDELLRPWACPCFRSDSASVPSVFCARILRFHEAPPPEAVAQPGPRISTFPPIQPSFTSHHPPHPHPHHRLVSSTTLSRIRQNEVYPLGRLAMTQPLGRLAGRIELD